MQLVSRTDVGVTVVCIIGTPGRGSGSMLSDVAGMAIGTTVSSSVGIVARIVDIISGGGCLVVGTSIGSSIGVADVVGCLVVGTSVGNSIDSANVASSRVVIADSKVGIFVDSSGELAGMEKIFANGVGMEIIMLPFSNAVATEYTGEVHFDPSQ